MTLEGTNTWVLGDPGARVVVDPGPPDRAHLDAVLAHGEVALVVLTHGHLDHAESVPVFHALAGRRRAGRRPGVVPRRRPAR